MAVIDNLKAMLARGQDSALLRYSLGSEYFKLGELASGLEHMAKALALDPGYSAAWKLYGKLLTESGRLVEAEQAYAQGIAAAEARGDIQAAKEMRVFRRRVMKRLG
jgi:Tfp pilus assembly protein PilF